MELGRYSPIRLLRYVARRACGTVYRFQTHEKVLALTFDDGPDPEDTPPVLDLLDHYGAKATFFMVGEAARNHREIVRQVASQAHTIGNHTFSHVSMPRTEWAERGRQLSACQQVLRPYAKKYFRMPFGQQSVMSHVQALLAGYRVFGWTHKADDAGGKDVAGTVRRLDGQLQAGDIVAFHDTVYHYYDSRQVCRQDMRDALQQLVSNYCDRGFRWINLETMMQIGRPERTHWYRFDDQVDFNRLKCKAVDQSFGRP
jgi:peptidoglycan/xylan/chitin deacetylase (PgdA/CDA1 family)